ncbi:hypothetical protein PFICI_14731 [Pestalotiopsis fici W106-1]|uniref:Uncharacterized protein n=1 Tax=Pestalotiopsis fici (strain W106-1 / CGMCC3.15140) TaxID=1229662 RepID=W3WIP3_PESFW|nr:uncharacterized protein PFICI_14731 [Pestalotiopsis fici W106-1]ETS73785.1 hypothetical protein PFICI_14731 [Pestalotiopsis fici W106-1]
MASFFSENNVSYYTIPAALGVALYPRFYSGIVGPGKKYFDRTNPRNFVGRLDKVEGLDKQLRLRLQRAESCSANAFETLPLFAAAVTAANAAGVSPVALNYLSLGYVASRVVYTWVYIYLLDNPKLFAWRTNVWTVGTVILMTLFIKAGLKSQP